MDRGRVAKDMRADVATDRCGALDPQWVGMAPDDLVEAEARKGTRPMGREERPSGRRRRARLSQQPRDRIDGLRPERADAPFVALPMQAHAGLRPQVEMLYAQVGNLLHAGAVL